MLLLGMYPRSATRLLTPPGLARFDEAYNDTRTPIGWWERNTEAAGLVQAYLYTLGYDLMQSVKVTDGGASITPDGAFGPETFRAVQKFQRDKGIKDDGMVGQNTFDELAKALDKPRPAHQFVRDVTIQSLKRPCRPGDLICPDPDVR
ncbi:peptidoglycan-binding domain-containing protein [Arvimicrobium flavum]|uniref:peptidoglycan-binding domain-containing protein n=1 Tax=Arvimicrobium flavum TaxID=3393320 RepID=UPI00237ABA3B|nr:peptidoglycan-binding domain-containing protein [Mesorhizobium shangrilense]